MASNAGEHYRVRALGADGPTLLEDGVLAIRRGDDLTLRYGDGSEVVLGRFFVECAPSQCAVEVGADAARSQWINGDSVAGATHADGAALLYAHGDQNTIGSLLQADGFLTGGSAALGDLAGLEVTDGQASYLPAIQVDGGAAAAGTATTIEGSVVAGPVLEDHGLTVGIYDANGELLKTGGIDAAANRG